MRAAAASLLKSGCDYKELISPSSLGFSTAPAVNTRLWKNHTWCSLHFPNSSLAAGSAVESSDTAIAPARLKRSLLSMSKSHYPWTGSRGHLSINPRPVTVVVDLKPDFAADYTDCVNPTRTDPCYKCVQSSHCKVLQEEAFTQWHRYED
ncbi:hypothetical protein INR49_008168 [Caranx melampygus]|nr:hypothetical protein INR49_008168 [Caranx melampygus]